MTASSDAGTLRPSNVRCLRHISSLLAATLSHVWNAGILSKNVLEPVVCIDLNVSNNRLAIGHRAGSFSCWKARIDASGKVEDLVLEAKHSARKTDSSVVKFSPNGNVLAVGFHENVIDVYAPLTLSFCRLIIHPLHF
jgi:hypothetical protein